MYGTHLAHEVGDDAVEAGPLEAVSLLSGAQRAEVLASPRHHVEAELKYNWVKYHNLTWIHLEGLLWVAVVNWGG